MWWDTSSDNTPVKPPLTSMRNSRRWVGRRRTIGTGSEATSSFLKVLEMYTVSMAGPPTAAFSQLIVNYTGIGVPLGAKTTHGITTPQGPIGDVLLAIGAAGLDLSGACTAGITIESIDWKVGPVATGPTVNVPVQINGARPGETAPPQVATLVRLPVVGATNRLAGRFYIPGVSEGSISAGGVLDNAFIDSAQGAVEAFYATLLSVGSEPRVFSSLSSDPREVVAVQVQPLVATQRRRLRR